MDGTLLNSQKLISEYTKESIRLLKEKKIEFTVCTGRVAPMVEYYTELLELKYPIITSNGAAIWDPNQKKILYEKAIPLNVANIIIKYCVSNARDCSVLTMKTCYFTKNSIRMKRFEQYNEIAKKNGLQCMNLEYITTDQMELLEHPIHKILIYDKNQSIIEKTKKWLKDVIEIDYTSSEEGLIDISAKGVNKGNGLLELMKIKNLKKQEVCVFGDYDNDITMANNVSLSFAMDNGCDELKAVATRIIESNDNDGLAKTIKKYIL